MATSLSHAAQNIKYGGRSQNEKNQPVGSVYSCNGNACVCRCRLFKRAARSPTGSGTAAQRHSAATQDGAPQTQPGTESQSLVGTWEFVEVELSAEFIEHEQLETQAEIDELYEWVSGFTIIWTFSSDGTGSATMNANSLNFTWTSNVGIIILEGDYGPPIEISYSFSGSRLRFEDDLLLSGGFGISSYFERV